MGIFAIVDYMNLSILSASTFLGEDKMSEIQKAKLFKNGGSQAIRIPAQWRFEEDEVFVRFDEDRKELIISQTKPEAMAGFFALLEKLGPISEEEWPAFDRDYPDSPRPGWDALIQIED